MRRYNKNIKVSLNHGDVRYRGISIPFRLLREPVLKEHRELCMEYELASLRKFNKDTGEIERKFAWDSIFIELKELNLLAPILNRILTEEKRNGRL